MYVCVRGRVFVCLSSCSRAGGTVASGPPPVPGLSPLHRGPSGS